MQTLLQRANEAIAERRAARATIRHIRELVAYLDGLASKGK